MFIIKPRRELSSVEPYEPGKPIETLLRETGLKRAVKMASNENPWGPSPLALKAARKALSGVHRYPDAQCFVLRKALAGKLNVRESQILVGNGSDELIVMAAKAFLEKGDEVVTAFPTFLIYKIASKLAGARVHEVPMLDYRYALNAMLDVISSKTKIVFIANPDNPVGSYITETELRRFLKMLPRGCLVFLDEAYFEFALSLKDYPRSIPLLEEWPNLFVTRTFSKAYGLSGLRVGYGIGSTELVQTLSKVREPFNVNSVAQAAATAALEDSAFLARVIKSNESEKKRIGSWLKQHQINFIESATNFILIELGAGAEEIYRRLMSKGIIVRWMGSWGMKEFIRVTIGKPNENGLFLKSLEDCLQ